jgi:hypothetical protein
MLLPLLAVAIPAATKVPIKARKAIVRMRISNPANQSVQVPPLNVIPAEQLVITHGLSFQNPSLRPVENRQPWSTPQVWVPKPYPLPIATAQVWVDPAEQLQVLDPVAAEVVLVPEDEVVASNPDVVDAREESVEGSTQMNEGLPLASATVVKIWPVAQIGSVMQ